MVKVARLLLKETKVSRTQAQPQILLRGYSKDD